MKEKPENNLEKTTNLEYSEFDERRERTEKALAEMRGRLERYERDLIKEKASYAEWHTFSIDESNEDLRQSIIGHIRSSVKHIKTSIGHIRDTIKTMEKVIERDKQLKAQVDEILRRGEHIDELIADIELEDKPPRSVN